MSQQDDGLLREVEEELRRERLEKIWKEYGTYVIAAAVAVVLAVMGYKYWESQRIASAYESGSRYEEALGLLAEKKTGSAEAEFEKIAKDGTAGYRALSLLQLAGAQSKEGKKTEALATYDSLANDNSADALLRSFARLQAAGLRLGEADFTEMENRLTPLMGDEDPWRFSARELLGLAAFKAGKLTADGSGGYRALADLQAAGLLVKEGKKAEALAAYDGLAGNNRADSLLRAFARLQAAGLRLGEADFTEMENRLTPLMGDKEPWRFNARELLGVAAYRAGRASEARTVLAPLLVDPATPEGVQERAQIVLAQIAAAELAEKAKAGASTTDAAPAAEATAPPASEPPAKKE